MSKLLKAVATKHRPHIAAKMTKENGYDENKHLLARDLKTSGVISKADSADLDECLDDLVGDGHTGAKALKAAGDGKLDPSKLNDTDFVNALMAMDDDGGNDSDDDDGDGDDLPTLKDDKITA